MATWRARLGPSWAVWGPSWALLGPSWGHFGAILEPSWPTSEVKLKDMKISKDKLTEKRQKSKRISIAF